MIIETVKTLRLKVKPESYSWLNQAAVEVNQVWNWANATSLKAARPYVGKGKWLSGFDLCNLSAGATEYFEHIGADTIQCINVEFARKRKQFKKLKLRWRVSKGAKRSLGWVPFKAASLKLKGKCLRFCGKSFRVFEQDKLEGVKWQQGCFAQDALGDWWLSLPVKVAVEQTSALKEAVGVDLGLKSVATTSDGVKLEAVRFYRDAEQKIAQAQRRSHKRQAKRLHRKVANRRKDALHQFSRKLVDTYQQIVIGNVSSASQTKTKNAKAVLDSGWGMLKTQLQYKGEHAGRSVEVVNEAYTTQVCSSCGCRSGPSGLGALGVREWTCSECGTEHDRDINAARNILALRCRASVSGNKSCHASAVGNGAKRDAA